MVVLDRFPCTKQWSTAPFKRLFFLHFRKAIPLNKNEGVYVRDLISGQVRCEMGPQAYLLKAHEQLYKKDLTNLVEEILK